ncbi:hypothetical protein IAT40_005959 [Kwoniella sp. CBS 6097]
MGSIRRLSLFVFIVLSALSFALARPTTTRASWPTATTTDELETGDSSWDFDPHGEAEEVDYEGWAPMEIYGRGYRYEAEESEGIDVMEEGSSLYGPLPRPESWTEETEEAGSEGQPRLLRRMYGGELEQREQIEMLDNLSNAQRMARGLPLRKPRQLYDHKLGARAPAASEVAKH